PAGPVGSCAVLWTWGPGGPGLGDGVQGQPQRLGAGQFYPLAPGQCQTDAEDIGTDRQFAGFEVHQGDQGYRGRTAIVEQLVERGASGATGHQHIINQHQLPTFHAEGQLGWPHPRLQADLREIVTVEGDIQTAQRGIREEAVTQLLGDPGTAGVDAHYRRIGALLTVQQGDQVLPHALQQCPDVG